MREQTLLSGTFDQNAFKFEKQMLDKGKCYKVVLLKCYISNLKFLGF
jgi:hypothetical protein